MKDNSPDFSLGRWIS